jgi:four helix bundle protein
MTIIKNFEEMIAWQKARELNKIIYSFSKNDGFKNDFALVGQIKRSSLSTMANIAEGFERDSKPQLKYFTNIALGSSGETRSHLYAARDAEYIDSELFEDALNRSLEISRLLRGFIKSIRNHS